MNPCLPIRNPQWFEDANCLGLDTNDFYPGEDEDEDRILIATRYHQDHVETIRPVCLSCPVRRDCLHAAINEHEGGPYNDIADHGFRGGMTPNERKQYVRAYWRTEGVN